jgi:hypothetical protein
MARRALVSLVALSIMTGLLRAVTDDDAALPWRRHIRATVSLGVLVMSGGSGRWRWATRLSLASMVGGYGDSILPIACIPSSSF